MPENESPRHCPLCRGLQVPGETTFTVDLGYGLVVIRQVPARVCDQCGASFIDDDIARELERMVAAAKQRRAQVEILTAAHLAV
jgi:YgiT-type zinc finger domain-containing protein